MDYENSEYNNVLPSYLDNPILKPRNFYETGLEEGLENIILKEDPVIEKDVVEKVFSDKSKTLKATVKALFNEILTRDNLDSKLLKTIDSSICDTNSYLEQIRAVTRRQYMPDLEIAFSRRRSQLETRAMDLEKEKRQEYHECWKDLMFLKKYLLSALKYYWNLSSRKSFLGIDNDRYRSAVQETEAYNWKQGG